MELFHRGRTELYGFGVIHKLCGWGHGRVEQSGLLILDGPFLACLNSPPSRGLYGPKAAHLAAKQQTDVVLLFHYITANCPSVARLRNAARATFGPPGFCKWEGLRALLRWKRNGLTEVVGPWTTDGGRSAGRTKAYCGRVIRLYILSVQVFWLTSGILNSFKGIQIGCNYVELGQFKS